MTLEIKKTPRLPEGPDLQGYQRFVRELVDHRDFTKDRNEVFILMVEEVGEIAKELRRSWKKPAEAKERIGSEIADVFMYLCDVANHFDVDIDEEVRKKAKVNEGRSWEY